MVMFLRWIIYPANIINTQDYTNKQQFQYSHLEYASQNLPIISSPWNVLWWVVEFETADYIINMPDELKNLLNVISQEELSEYSKIHNKKCEGKVVKAVLPNRRNNNGPIQYCQQVKPESRSSILQREQW